VRWSENSKKNVTLSLKRMEAVELGPQISLLLEPEVGAWLRRSL